MKKTIAVAAVLAVAACGPKGAEAPKSPEAPVATAPQPANAATLQAATVAPSTLEQAAVSVNKVVPLKRGDAKLYSTVGGDPAINGEYVFLAVIGEPQQGWKVFQLGDFNSWEVVEDGADKVVLAVSHSAVEQATGEIVTQEQRIAVTVPTYEAMSVAVTPLP